MGFASGKDAKQALEAHASQIHQGSDPGNKSFTAGATGGAGVVSGLVPLGAPVKQPKQAVSYRKADDPARSCGTCYMFVNGDTCTSVAGRIKPGDMCDLWMPRDGAPSKKVSSPQSPQPGAPDQGNPYVAGLMVRAADTGRVLMLQRAIDDDPGGAAGKLEPPGGHVAEGETLLQGALREWAEETGLTPPQGTLVGSWTSSDGIYRGFVLQVPSEDALDLKDGRDEVWNPDNPDGDKFEAILWVDPQDFAGNPLVREEMQRDLPLVMDAMNGVTKSARGQTSAEILREYWTREGHPGPTQYALEEKIARAHAGPGHGRTQAIATAINAVSGGAG